MITAISPWWQISGLCRHRHTHSFWRRVRKTRAAGACWEWTGARSGSGYGCFRWHGRMHYAHRLAYEFSHGPIPVGMIVRHHCHNPLCCRPTHLAIGRPADNSHDMALAGRARSRTLTHDQVVELRALAPAMSSRQLSERFGISQRAAWKVAAGITYRHLGATA